MATKGRRPTSSTTLAAVYIGTVIGAGFASGQEVLQFFALLGPLGFLALAVATAVLALFGYLVLAAGHTLRAQSYGPVLLHVAGPLVGRIIDVIITFFLFGGLAAMLAGAGATLNQEFGLPLEAGLLGMGILTALTVLAGIHGVITAVSVVVPLLLGGVLVVSAGTLLGHPVDLSFSRPQEAAVPNWFLSGVTYGSYNLILSTSVLAPVARLARRPSLLPGALLGGVGLGLSALAVNLTILAHVPEAAATEVPMLFAADRLSPLIGLAYTAVLLAEVYTTAVGSLFGFVSRTVGEGHRWFKAVTLGTTAAAGLAATVGFSTIVGTLYPLVGYAGLLLLAALALAALRGRL